MIGFTLHNVKLYFKQIYYWLIVVLTLVISILFYFLYYQDHLTGQYWSAVSPPSKYMMVILGGFPLLLMACFLCFVGRNLMTRDEFYRIHEVVVSRPLSNFQLLASRVFALVIVGWLPIAAYIGFIQLSAVLHNFVDINFSETFETVAMLKFLFITCPVTLSFVAVLSLLYNLVFRNNVLTMVALVGTVVGGSFLLTKISLSQYFFFEGLPLIGNVGSALNPDSIGFFDFVRYAGFMSIVMFLFFVSVPLYRRSDMFMHRNLIAGTIGGIVLILCVSTTTTLAFENAGKIKHWMEGQHSDTISKSPQVDFINLSANVVLEPARELVVNTEVTVSVLSETIKDELVLWLNPGLKVSDVMIDGMNVHHELVAMGTLIIGLEEPLEQGQHIQIQLSYRGKPDLDFGYFDSSTQISKIALWDQLLTYLGDVHGIFSSNFVALPQELIWLPAPFLPQYEQRARKDFFDSHVVLTLPSTWEAALPGRRDVADSELLLEDKKTYEFHSDSPVSSISLFAGPLTAISRGISGTTFEVLLSEKQLASHPVINESIISLATELAEKLDENRTDGFELPCSTYRIITVPRSLRVYGGGTFLNLMLSGKCSYLLREFDFFSVEWQSAIPEQLEQWGIARETFVVQVVRNYFRFGFQGTNFELDLYDNYWDVDVGIVGPEAELLSLVLAYLNDLVWYENMNGFSASGYFPTTMGRKRSNFQQSILFYGGQVHVGLTRHWILQTMKPMIRHIDLVEQVMTQSLYTEKLQLAALRTSIEKTLSADLDPFTVETLRMRCAHLSFQLFQVLERDGAKLLLDELLARFRHSNFRVEDLYATGADLGLPVEEVLGDWFNSIAQPRYAISGAVTYKREGLSEDEEAEFQTLFHVRNTGDGTGVFRTSVTTQMAGLGVMGGDLGAQYALAYGPRYGASTPGPVVYLGPRQSVEVGIVSEQEPIRVLVQPLNISVGGGRIAVPTKFVEDTRNVAPARLEEFHGFRASTWVPPQEPTSIVVDDLDSDFSVENGKEVANVKTWRRIDYPSAWGSSRRTMVYCDSKNPKSIKFQTDLPNAGLWSLEFHLPDMRGQFGDYQQGFLPRGRIGSGGGSMFFWQRIAGEYTFTVSSGDFSDVVNVSVSDSDFGWIRVTEAQLNHGTAVVSVAPRSSSEKLFGDAIRWVPVDAGE